MRIYRHFAAVSVFTLALAACGTPAEEEDTSAGEAEEVTAEEEAIADEGDAAEGEGAGAEEASEAEAAEEEPAPEPSATPTPTPTPTPTQVAVSAAPASFTQCGICHSVEPDKSGIGPSLAGIVGRRSASISSFSYSPAMREAGLTWNEATLSRYLGDPAGVVPGTTMALPGIPAADRAAIIAYLKTL